MLISDNHYFSAVTVILYVHWLQHCYLLFCTYASVCVANVRVAVAKVWSQSVLKHLHTICFPAHVGLSVSQM